MTNIRTVVYGTQLMRVYERGGVTFGSGGYRELTKQQAMDLMSTKTLIREQSRKEKNKTLFVNIDDEGECSISDTFVKDESAYAFRNGSEIAIELIEEPRKKNKKKINQTSEDANLESMATAKSTKPAKKAAKKVSKKNEGSAYGPKVSGPKATMTVKAIVAALKAGKTVRKASDGYYLSVAYLKGKDEAATYEVVVKESKRKK